MKNISYQHNALGNRVARSVDGIVVEKYLWLDKTTLVATYDKDDNLVQRFEYADGNTPVSFTQNNQRYYIVTDHLGTPRAITDNNGTMVKKVEYDSFGNVISDSNPSISIPFGFAGGLQDNDTKLVRFGFRVYDPETGRWTARDPIGFAGGDSNLYGYVFSDPVNFVDPSGLLSIVTTGGISSTPIKGIGGQVGIYGTTRGASGSGENGALATGSITTRFGVGIDVMINILKGGIENIVGRSTTDQVCLGVCLALHKNANGDFIGIGVGIGLEAGFTHYDNKTKTIPFSLPKSINRRKNSKCN